MRSLGSTFASLESDADVARAIAKSSANSDLLYDRPEVATYISKAILTRLPLILTGSDIVAREIRSAAPHAVHVVGFKAPGGFVRSVGAVAHYFDGVYVLLTGPEALSWSPYFLGRNIWHMMRYDRRTFVGLTYASGPITPSSLAAALNGAVQVHGSYGAVADDAIKLVKTFWPELTKLPDLVPLLGKLAATARPKFSKQIVKECLAPAKLDARLFRKHLRAEKAALEYAKQGQSVREGLCA